jgi:anti-anti-sigma factor
MSSLRLHQETGVFVVSFDDRELTGDVRIKQVADELRAVLDSAPKGTRLLLDCQAVQIVGSAMLAEFVALHKRAQQTGVHLQFCRLSPDVMRIVEICRLNQMFEILDELPDNLNQ